MTDFNVRAATTRQLVDFYNEHTHDRRIKKFLDRPTAEKRVQRLIDEMRAMAALADRIARPVGQASAKPAKPQRPAMQSTLKLDRRVRHVATGQTWKNCYQLWRAQPEWMTSAQVDRLTAQLYAAAKKGYKITVTVNGREFSLVKVGG